jgi:MOSC domain-containing protein YiiM
MENVSGRIVGLCTNPHQGLRKYLQMNVKVGQYGFVGDYHNKPFRIDFKNPTGSWIPNNDRHILIIGQEALDEVNQELGLSLGVGSLGENILTEGLGNLSDVEPDSTVRIGIDGKVRLRVVKQNKPCQKTAPIHPLFNATIYNQSKNLYRRGLLCVIEHGIGQFLHSVPNGEPISITSSRTPF